MTHEHLSHEDLYAFLRGQLPMDETKGHLQHILQGCTRCSELIRETLSRKRGMPEEGYAQAFLDTANFVVDKEAPLALERIAAPGLSARLLDLSWEQRRLLVANDPRYRTFGLCERLIQESRQAIWNVHSETIVDRARCAVLVGEHVDPAAYGEPYVVDLVAFAYAALANGYRLSSKFALAEENLDIAAAYLERGRGHALESLRLTSYRASLLATLGRFEESVELLRSRLREAAGCGDDRLHARLLLQMGMALSWFDPAAALDVLREAERRVDRRDSPRLAFCARRNLVWSLNACGRSHEALMEFHASRNLFRQFPDRWAQLHLRWTEARLAFDLGHPEEAEAAYQRLWGRAFELDLRLDTALISLDMIEIQIVLGRHTDAITVARRLVDLFSAWNVHREAMHAWALLLEALRRHTASRELVGEVALYLRRAWKNPELKFSRLTAPS